MTFVSRYPVTENIPEHMYLNLLIQELIARTLYFFGLLPWSPWLLSLTALKHMDAKMLRQVHKVPWQQALLITFSLPVFSPANLLMQHDSSWPIAGQSDLRSAKKVALLPWLIKHFVAPWRAEEQVVSRSTFWHEMVNLGDKFPNFEADTSQGKIKFHDYIGEKWVLHLHNY